MFKKYVNLSGFYLLLSLVLGVFYREFTKFNNFTANTTLKSLHSHGLILGFIFFIIILLLDYNFNISNNKYYKAWLIIYNLSLIYTLISLLIRGILQVKGIDFVGLSHIAGLGHFLLGSSLIYFFVILKKSIK